MKTYINRGNKATKTGFGEGVDDLAVFDPESFVDKILM